MKVKAWSRIRLRWEERGVIASIRIIDRSGYSFERFEYERICWDPKDGELCLDRAKPEETLVEARRGSDVQIDLEIWV